MITYATNSIFESSAQALVNPVNTVGVMGKGLAKAFRERYPEMFREYRQVCQLGNLSIGKLDIYRNTEKVIINFPTKPHWNQPSKVDCIDLGLYRFTKIYRQHGIPSVSFPQLGCGLGGLSWGKQVQPIMEYYLNDLSIDVYIHIYGG